MSQWVLVDTGLQRMTFLQRKTYKQETHWTTLSLPRESEGHETGFVEHLEKVTSEGGLFK